MYADATLIQRLFKKDNLQEVDEGELDQWLERYPYLSCLYWLKARKNVNDKEALRQAALYAYYPRLLQHYLESAPAEEALQKTKDVPEEKQPSGPAEKKIAAAAAAAASETATGESKSAVRPPLQPLYTEDYFAYTRTRLPEKIDNDKPPTLEQVRSFTGWLRMMKRTPGEGTASDEAAAKEDTEAENASLQQREVVTESMAAIWEQHGQRGKAIEIYEKLILLNPEKSVYFAAKIRALKKP